MNETTLIKRLATNFIKNQKNKIKVSEIRQIKNESQLKIFNKKITKAYKTKCVI
jgi:hypothetical protein